MDNSNIVANHSELVAIAATDIHAQHGHPTTTSILVAKRFGKQHNVVLRSIRNIIKEAPMYACNFALIQIDVNLGNGRVRKDPAYAITEKGFTVLAMGFTGAKALHWKIAYAEAFEKMRHALSRFVSFGVPEDLYNKALEAEKQEAGSFAKASVAGRTLSLRRKEKKAFQGIVAMVREEVQLSLLLGSMEAPKALTGE